ncbi:MAG: glycosyltransferase family 4 protein [Cyanobacteria bacterium J06627_8]
MADVSRRPLLFLFLEIFNQEGGIQTYNKDLFGEYLQLESCPKADVFLLRDRRTKHNPFEQKHLQFHYFQLASAKLGRLWFAIAAFSYAVKHRPQRIFCGHLKLARLTQFIGQTLNLPYTVMTYGKEVWEPLSMSDREALVHADQIWTVSRHTRDRTCQVNQLNPNRFRLLPCAVDGDVFVPGEKSGPLIQRYGLEQSKVLLTVARLWSGDIYKGVDVTIRALPKILSAVPAVKYLVIGRGDDQPRLAQLAEDLGVSDRVVFAGFVPTEQLVDHYRLADGYVMPSQEGFGVVYLEAMACGIPVIAGDNDGSTDPLQDGQVGWHVPHRDSDAVADACIQLLKGHDQRCDSSWIREQTLAGFGKLAFRKTLATLLS